MNKKSDIFDKVLSLIAVFVSTALIPPALSSIIDYNINIAVLAAIVGTVILVIVYLVQYVVHIGDEKSSADIQFQKTHYQKFLLYSISSMYWCDLFDRKGLHAVDATIMVRSYVDDVPNFDHFCDKEVYIQEADNAINRWIKLQHDGRINKLAIYAYTHLPDHYYGIFDGEELLTGVNDLATHDSTGQYGNRIPQILYAKSSESARRQIESYIKHFDNYKEHCCTKIYDSSDGTRHTLREFILAGE